MKDTRILDFLNSTLSGADSYHNEALGPVADSRNAYQGLPYGNEVEGRSAIVSKDIQRTVQGALPSIVEPFLGDEIVSIESEIPSQKDSCRKAEALINYQWSRKHRPLELMETIAVNLMVDGTAWVMTGWDAEGYPTLSVVPFESVIPDPAATKPEEMRFVIYRRKVSVSEILSNPEWFGKQSKQSLQVLMPDTESEYDPRPEPGRQDDYNPDDRALEKLELFEYYGWYDMDGDGIAEPVLAIWHKDKLLKMVESPFPFGPIPFDTAVYVRKPFTIYGATIEELLGDYQRLRTSITRGIVDNMSNSNSGTKFIRKGSLDAVNWNRLRRGEPYVEINAPSQMHADALIYDGNFNPIPQAVFALSEEIMKEEENLSGITRYAIGSDSRSLNQMLCVDTPIPMADGTYKRNGDIVVGDRIVGSDGLPVTVIGAHKAKYPERSYKMTFSSGEVLYAGGEHLWTVKVRDMRKKWSEYRLHGDWYTVDTDMLFSVIDDVESVQIPRIPGFFNENPESPSIDPYALGYWLGNGNTHKAHITTIDDDVVSVFRSRGYDMRRAKSQNCGAATEYTVSVFDKDGSSRRNGTTGRFDSGDSFHSRLKEAGVLGGKHIPEEVFGWSYEDRLMLLRGLMDSDGCWHSRGSVVFSQSEGPLLDGFVRLVESLGWFPKVRISRESGSTTLLNGTEITTTKDHYKVYFTALENPFVIERKASRWRKPSKRMLERQTIVSIEDAEPRLMRCLTVDAEDSLYCAGRRFTVTHNTATGIGIISSMSQRRLIYITRHLASMMERVFTKWAALNAELIDEVVVPTLQGDIVVDGTTLPVDGFGIKVTTPTEGIKETKRQQIVSMIQSLAPMIQFTGATPVLSLLGDMAELMDMPNVKLMLMQAQQEAERNKGLTQQMAMQQQQIEQMKAQIEMMKDSAGAQKDQALSQKYLAEADAERYDTILKSYGQGA